MNNDIRAIAHEFLKAVTAQLDPYTTQQGEIKDVGNAVVLLSPPHIQFAKYGRGPGKPPPFDPIFDWVKSRGIQFGELSQEGTANAIVWGIAKNGTKSWVPDAPDALEEAIAESSAQYKSELLNMLSVQVTNEVKQIQMLPSDFNTFKI